MAYQLLLSQGCGLLGYKQPELSDSNTTTLRTFGRSKEHGTHTTPEVPSPPNGVILLGRKKNKKKILFSFGTCTSSITSCLPLQILAGGGGASYSWNTS